MKLLPSQAGERPKGQLLALSGLAIALLLWTYGDQLHDDHRAIEQRLAPLASRSAALRSADLGAAQVAADKAAERRQALEKRLKVQQSEQLMRASVLYDLRSACAAAGVKSCSVRLSETNATAAVAAADRPKAGSAGTSGGLETLGNLGIGRARAIVSGNLANDELDQIFAILLRQEGAVWRINAFNVRNNSFEIDVERHFIAPGTTESTRP